MDELTFNRELLQAKLLVELMSNAVHQELVLKGGLAMRAVLGSTRFTKDIDLDAVTEASVARIQGIVRRSIARVVRQSGLIESAQVSEPKQTETTLRWKVNGLAPGSKRPLNLTVEVSRRPWAAPFRTNELDLSPEFAGGSARGRVLVLDAEALAVCKVLALTDPKRDAPRDLFDLGILVETGVEAPFQLLAAQTVSRLQEVLDELWSKIESMSYDRFRAEVAPYLLPTTAAEVTPMAYEQLQMTVAENVERWLLKALELKESETTEGEKAAPSGNST
jgi:predicted nucleotidyltransferase component of viral defense system